MEEKLRRPSVWEIKAKLVQGELDAALATIEVMKVRATALEKIIDMAETFIPDSELPTYYESLDHV